jgi:metacaspase-1
MKKAICIGINNYPGTVNDLNGCVNDANDWSTLLTSFGFETTKIIDNQATKSNILTSFESLINNASAGDVVVLTYSGHGTQVLDTSGDEQDAYDEALCAYDENIIDDELGLILKNANTGVQIIVISDSCFSGTVTRIMKSDTIRSRFIKTDDIPPTATLKKKFLAKASEENMVEILLSGCSDSEYSYDAFINGKWNGVMTANAISIIKPEQTYIEFYTKLRKVLPSNDYPQTPQLEGAEKNKSKLVFSEKTGGGSNGNGNSGSTGCMSVLLSFAAIAAIVLVLFSVVF